MSGLGLNSQKSQGLARKFSRDSKHSERGRRVYYVKTEGLFMKFATRRGMERLRPSDWVLKAGIRSKSAYTVEPRITRSTAEDLPRPNQIRTARFYIYGPNLIARKGIRCYNLVHPSPIRRPSFDIAHRVSPKPPTVNTGGRARHPTAAPWPDMAIWRPTGLIQAKLHRRKEEREAKPPGRPYQSVVARVIPTTWRRGSPAWFNVDERFNAPEAKTIPGDPCAGFRRSRRWIQSTTRRASRRLANLGARRTERRALAAIFSRWSLMGLRQLYARCGGTCGGGGWRQPAPRDTGVRPRLLRSWPPRMAEILLGRRRPGPTSPQRRPVAAQSSTGLALWSRTHGQGGWSTDRGHRWPNLRDLRADLVLGRILPRGRSAWPRGSRVSGSASGRGGRICTDPTRQCSRCAVSWAAELTGAMGLGFGLAGLHGGGE
jgi:hypothetical protein